MKRMEACCRLQTHESLIQEHRGIHHTSHRRTQQKEASAGSIQTSPSWKLL